jgi:hypothetical protein
MTSVENGYQIREKIFFFFKIKKGTNKPKSCNRVVIAENIRLLSSFYSMNCIGIHISTDFLSLGSGGFFRALEAFT